MLKAYVQFKVPQLFIDEVKAEREQIEDGVVRITRIIKRDHAAHHQHNVYVMATAIRGELVLRLTAPCGPLIGDKPKDEKVEKAAEKMQVDLERDLKDLGMDVRNGGYITAIAAEAA